MTTCENCGKTCSSSSGFTLHKQHGCKPKAPKTPKPKAERVCQYINGDSEHGTPAHVKVYYDQGDGQEAFLYACTDCQERAAQDFKATRVTNLVGVSKTIGPKPRTKAEQATIFKAINEALSRLPSGSSAEW